MRYIRRVLWALLYGPRKNQLLFALTLWTLAALMMTSHLSRWSTQALLPPPPEDKPLKHFAKERSLGRYLDEMTLLIEPSSACVGEVPVVALVGSAPGHWRQRDVIRSTWGRQLTTYFIMGLGGPDINEELTDNYVEAKQHGDLVVYDFQDHYQNLTLKTALMLQWTRLRCARAQFMYKVDDDVLVNPWRLWEVLRDHEEAQLLGYQMNATRLHRSQHNKWYLPRWLHAADTVARYLNGPGYLISGDTIPALLEAAKEVPLHNIEDVYFTNTVAVKKLGFNLTHDGRLTPYRPSLNLVCAYWSKASSHSLTPEELEATWRKLEELGEEYDRDGRVCGFYDTFLDWLVSWY